MRFPVLFFLFFLFFVDSNAQSVVVENDSTGNKLSEIEFNVLKERYLNMLESKTYDLVRRMHRQIGKKKNGLHFPDPSKDKRWFVDENYTKEWLALHIEETKFKSVDEVYNLYVEMVALTQKQLDENKEVYLLIRRVDKKQSREIFDLEIKWNQANMIE